MHNWVFAHNRNDTARYTLGDLGVNNLICVGINPSTAIPNKLDNTLKKVRAIAEQNGFDGWVMLNIYPQRDKNPENIHPEQEEAIIQANQSAIRSLLKFGSFRNVWAAWGNDIYTRPFLKDCLSGIVDCFDNKFTWFHFGELTAKGNPRHPSRIGYGNTFIEFDIESYMQKL